MAKIHFTKLDNPFKLIFSDFKMHFKYLFLTAFLSQLFYVIALLPKYLEKHFHFYPIPFLVISLISTIVFCVFFWRFIQKTFGLCLIAKAKILDEEFDIKEIDKTIKEKTKPLVKFLSFGALVGIFATLSYLALTYVFYILHENLFNGPFLMMSDFFYMNKIVLGLLSFGAFLAFVYFNARFFGLSFQSFLFDNQHTLSPYKASWSMLKNNVFAISFPIVLTTFVSYIPIFAIFVLISVIFSFMPPVFVAIAMDILNSTIFLILTTLFTIYILTSAYIKAKD